MASRVRDVDKGAKALVKRVGLARSPPLMITIGIHEAEGDADSGGGATVAEIGSFHEFGLGVPQRSFLRGWADENEERNYEHLQSIGRAVLDGRLTSVRQGLERFGLVAVGEIQQRMAAGIDPNKADDSVATLIDTGVMRSSITSKVGKP